MKKVFVYGLSVCVVTLMLVGCGAGSEGACCESPSKESLSIVRKGLIDNNATKKIEKIQERPKKIAIIKPIPPVAVAHANGQYKLIKVSNCESVTFDADSSYDPDGDSEKLSYVWSDLDKKVVSNDSSFKKMFSNKGLYEMTLTVTDEQNLTDVDRVCVLSGISEMCMPLLADAGEDRVVKVGEKVTLKGRGICRDDIVKHTWKENGKVISTKDSFDTTLSLGKHTLTLVIEDMEGNTATTTVVVSVIN